MNATLTDEDCYAIFIASQDACNRMEATEKSRLYQLELLYQTIRINGRTDSILQAIAGLDEQRDEQRKQYWALVLAHKEVCDALNVQRRTPQ